MIAAGELKIPPRVDVLYVEQEVLADDTPAVDAVLKADKYAPLLCRVPIIGLLECCSQNLILESSP